MKLNTDDDNVFQTDMSVEKARELTGSLGDDDLDTALDEAQGYVFTGRGNAAYVLIKITK